MNTCTQTHDRLAPLTPLFVHRPASNDYIDAWTGEILESTADLECDFIVVSERTYHEPARGETFEGTYIQYNPCAAHPFDRHSHLTHAVVNVLIF